MHKNPVSARRGLRRLSRAGPCRGHADRGFSGAPMGATEISGNTRGRVPNKGMEGLALSPDGATPFGQRLPERRTRRLAHPNQFYVFTFDDADLGGSAYEPQRFRQPK